MDFAALFVAAVAVTPALGVVLWIGRAMSMADEDLRAFVGIAGGVSKTGSSFHLDPRGLS